jgi:uncharacterized protein YjbI with pentapeptide repeats
MGTAPGSADKSPICSCKHWMRGSCCTEFEFLVAKDGSSWCVLHYQIADRKILTEADNTKLSLFESAVQKRLREGKHLFQGVWFPNPFDLGHAASVLQSADFREATFTRQAHFKDASFEGGATFEEAHFESACAFDGAKFKSKTSFRQARFDQHTTFEHATFALSAGRVDFNDATFSGTVSFAKANVRADLNFSRSSFLASVDFSGSELESKLFFTDCSFDSQAHFSMNRSKVGSIVRFTGAHFRGQIELKDINVTRGSQIDFSESVISAGLNVSGGTWHRDEAKRSSIQPAASSSHRLSSLTVALKQLISDAPSSISRLFFRKEFPIQQSSQDSQEPKGELRFAHARIDKPEAVTFQRVRLTPSWFTNTEVRKMTLRGVSWYGWNGAPWSSAVEIDHLAQKRESDSYESIAITYRQLAINAAENHRYQEASDFRFAAMDVPRHRSAKDANILGLHWWYWLMSGYGERVGRAFAVLMFVVVLFAFIYMHLPFEGSNSASPTSQPATGFVTMTFPEALLYSARSASLREPTPHPASLRGKLAVAAESTFAPIQAALLLLAVRRRFTRSSAE